MALVISRPDCLAGKTVVLTGGFIDEEYREDFKQAIVSCGGICKTNVTPNTDVVVWEPAVFGETKKLKEAREYNGTGTKILILTALEFAAMLAGEDVKPGVEQISNHISHIAKYIVVTDPKRAEEHLRTHVLTTQANQALLLELLKSYNRLSLTLQQEWCDLVADTAGLDPEIYKAAAKYFMRTADYDRAELMCDVAEASSQNANISFSSQADNLTKLRSTLERYRIVPYWPTKLQLRQELAVIYDSKGISHPSPDSVPRFSHSSHISRKASGEATALRTPEPLSEDLLTQIRDSIDAIDYFGNEDGKYSRFIDPDHFDIRGLGNSTVSVLLDGGWISSFGDIFRLKKHREEIIASGLLTETKTDDVLASIENARHVSDIRLLSSLSIPGLGESTARSLLSEYTIKDFLDLCLTHEDLYEFVNVKSVSSHISACIMIWFENETNVEILNDLLREVEIREESKEEKGARCEGLVFVVTGDVYIYKKRQELKDYIISQGGTLAGSVSKNTHFLINNDLNSPSSKNQKAHSLGVPIISEQEFIDRFAK